MCPEALVEKIDNISKIYRSEHYPGLCIRSAYPADDARLIELFAETIPCDYFDIQLKREPSYLAVSHLQYNRSETKVIVPEKYPEEVIGMLNIGWKYCYINEKPDLIRYISDLKITPKYRNRNLIAFLMQYLQEIMPQDGMVQSIVLNNHAVLQNILYQPKSYLPRAYAYDDVDVYTLSQMSKPKAFANFHFKLLTKSQIPAVNEFVESLKTDFNFLPHYDFKHLVDQVNPYWRGMQLSDFYVVYNQVKQIVGIYGLWDQSGFKQIQLKNYAASYHYLRPFYNIFASFSQRMALPTENEDLNYLMLHSALCKPAYTELYASMLYHALRHTRMRKKDACCVALASNDARRLAFKGTHYFKLSAQHRLHSFYQNPLNYLDRNKISYFELGRL